MHRGWRIFAQVVVGIMLLWGIVHAARGKYEQKIQTVREGCKAASAKLSPKQLEQVPCSTPEISLVSRKTIKPGETAEVVVNGKFPAGTSFVFESDQVEVLKETSNANSYRATIKAAPVSGPRTISISAYLPVCCKYAQLYHAFGIVGEYEWEFKVSNGWIVRARPLAKGQVSSRNQDIDYTAEFYRPGETAAFAKRKAVLHPASSEPAEYYFSISSQDEASLNTQLSMEDLGQQLQNPNLSNAEREKLLKQLQDGMAQMTKQMGDPSYMKKLQAQQQEFGCTGLRAKEQNNTLTGYLNCSEKVGRNLTLTGVMKPLSR